MIDTIVEVAERTADELTHSDGRDVKLEEDVQLQLPFLLPEEGYSSDIIRGVPPGLQEFLEPLCDTGAFDMLAFLFLAIITVVTFSLDHSLARIIPY